MGALTGLYACTLAGSGAASERIDLTHATVVVRRDAPLVERSAATVLIEEVARRTGIQWVSSATWPDRGWAIAVTSGAGALDALSPPASARSSAADGYGVVTDQRDHSRPVLWIAGSDPRGALFGVGRVLRSLECRRGRAELPAPMDLRTSPRYQIRGHQLGYRAQANSYDAWSPEQFDQYIRELAIFGSNAVEGIPFHDTRPTVNNYARSKMNVDISRSCQRYGQDYWLWAPADFDLKDPVRRSAVLHEHDELFKACPVLTGVFVAGGDPGDNAAELVIPYLTDLSSLLAKSHPEARVWLSMQGYSPSQQDFVYHWIETARPAWLGGLVGGPSSPPLQVVRARLPRQYGLRDYPDITHSVRCQFPVPWWDPAFAFTLGRECANPRPLFFSRVFRDTSAFTDGFISYSDGIHDDVNKLIWSVLGWEPDAEPMSILTDYCRFFFGPDAADAAASGILALERNWDGPLASNGGVDGTLAIWKALEHEQSGLHGNWRWQLCLLRAYYDAFIRHRLIHESLLEDQANVAMLGAGRAGSAAAIASALATLKRADTEPVRPDLRARIVQLCEDLYRSIGLQSSVEKYHACGSERGCVLDFVDYPLNNRWWLEDELAAALRAPDESQRVARLEALARWEHPGPGSHYDAIGHVARSPHEVRNERIAGPILDMDSMALPGVMHWTDGSPYARVRQTWVTSENWPEAIKYVALDPSATYTIRTTGCGECLLRVNGQRLAPTVNGKKVGEVKEFPVPHGLYLDGNITVTFDPTFEPELNWRVQSRLCEIWLIKQ